MGAGQADEEFKQDVKEMIDGVLELITEIEQLYLTTAILQAPHPNR